MIIKVKTLDFCHYEYGDVHVMTFEFELSTEVCAYGC